MGRCSPSWIWRWVFASICSLLGGCDSGCIRNSQCSGGAVCSLGSCVQPPADARGEGQLRDGGGEGAKAEDASPRDGAREVGDTGTKPDGGAPDGMLDGLKQPDGGAPDSKATPDLSKELGGG